MLDQILQRPPAALAHKPRRHPGLPPMYRCCENTGYDDSAR